jgi:4-alpha-glucanotransferase
MNGLKFSRHANMRIDGAGRSPFSPGYHASGLLLHTTSLPSKNGIGDVGPPALAWIDQLRQAGQRWWQALPLGPTGYGNSPYQPLPSFAGHEPIVNAEWLTDDLLSPAAFDWLRNLTKETNRCAVHSAGAGSPALQETEVTR